MDEENVRFRIFKFVNPVSVLSAILYLFAAL